MKQLINELSEIHQAINAYHVQGLHAEALDLHTRFLRTASKLAGKKEQHAKADKKVLKELAEIAETIDHCGDYGDGYYNPTTGQVFWNMADSDGEPDFTGYKEIERRFLEHPAVKSVEAEAECSGYYDDPDWIHIDYDRSKAAERRKNNEDY